MRTWLAATNASAQKIGGALAPVAPPVPTPLQSLYYTIYGLTWSDPGQVSADYHGGEHDSCQTKSSCNSHKLLVVGQRRAPAKHGGTAHTHASARPTDTRTAHVQQRASHFTTKWFSRSVLSRPVSCALPCGVSPSVTPLLTQVRSNNCVTPPSK